MNVINSIINMYVKGGIMMWPILLLCLIGVAVIIERIWYMYRIKVDTAEFMRDIRQAVLKKNIKLAVELCEQNRGPIATLLKAGLLRYGRPMEEIEHAIESAAIHEVGQLEKRLAWLATGANLAPMFGFLGTVTGMIKSFEQLAAVGLGNPAAVARGISEALITTAAGLIVAIPLQVAYNYFIQRVAEFVRDMEISSSMLMETVREAGGGTT